MKWNGEKSRQAASQIAELIAGARNGPAHNALAGVCFCSGRARPCPGAANVASEMTSFTIHSRAGGGCGLVHPGALPRTPVPARGPQALLFPSCILCSRRYKRVRTSMHQERYVMTMGTENA